MGKEENPELGSLGCFLKEYVKGNSLRFAHFRILTYTKWEFIIST